MKRFTPEQERILNEWARTAPELRRAFPYTNASDVATKGLGFLLNKELDLERFYISVQQSDGFQRLDVTELLSFNKDSFYLTHTSDPNEIMVNFRGTAGGGSSGSVSSTITFSDGVPPDFDSDKLTFNKNQFYLSKDFFGKPIVNINDSTSITVTDGPSKYTKISQISFNNQDFYISRDSLGQPEINAKSKFKIVADGITISNTNSETNAVDFVVPGGALKVGDRLNVKISGVLFNNTAGTRTFIYTVYWGDNVIWKGTSSSFSSLNHFRPFTIEQD